MEVQRGAFALGKGRSNTGVLKQALQKITSHREKNCFLFVSPIMVIRGGNGKVQIT